MDAFQKDDLYRQSQAHVAQTQQKIAEEVVRMDESVERGQKEWRSQSAEDRVVIDRFLAHYTERKEELRQLAPSPYFVRCDLDLDNTGVVKNYYFAKFPLSEASIYSWTAPAASLRFESPGKVSYSTDEGEVHEGRLARKDQYMIVDGKIKFFSYESTNSPRELVYQEHFSTRKEGFVLQEIVAQMEKAQDQVIRASHQGPFVISGPAGSGKTTLALHRVAYLMQSPDTSVHYPSESVIVFVQDNGTRDYFAHLLPDLGIKHVTITTFSDWAMRVLSLKGYKYGKVLAESSVATDEYEYAKIQALREWKEDAQTYYASPYTLLDHVYKSSLADKLADVWKSQKLAKQLDRIDLTLLLKSQSESRTGLTQEVETYVRQKNGTYKRKYTQAKVRYNLMIIDEFQNYLPEQLHLFAKCQHPHLNSTVYVGDLAQQVQLGTLRKWEDLGQEVNNERRVRLQKVYRNTKEILYFVNALGYTVNIPKELKSGPAVTERTQVSPREEIAEIHRAISAQEHGDIGIISFNPSYLQPFKAEFADNARVHCLTMYEAQGVEFDTVFIVGVTHDMFTLDHHDESLLKEKRRIYKDLLYVALTRAMREMHVSGAASIKIALDEMQGE